MRKRSKRYRALAEAVGEENLKKPHAIEEAVGMLMKGGAKFTESVDLAINLSIDPRKSDQLVRGSFALPNGTGKNVRVIAFAEGELAEAAKAAGAIEVGGQDLADKVAGGWLDFDIAIAHPSMMRFVGKLGKVLGPKGLMPSPKSGTVTPDVGTAVKEFSGGRIEFRNDNHGSVCVSVGNAGFEEQALVENVSAFISNINSLRPAVVKGEFIKSAYLSTTMGLGLRLDV
ncbi:MAG: 50S ribosomal protein L1 [Planctomycetota bacterium]|jgi:large subunit ribosomal protein L1